MHDKCLEGVRQLLVAMVAGMEAGMLDALMGPSIYGSFP